MQYEQTRKHACLKMKILRLWIAAHFFIYACTAFANTYVVKTGDSLSKIASKLVEGPIYGSGHNLEKIIKLNSQIANPNLIFPGQKIYLGVLNLIPDNPKRTVANNQENASVAENVLQTVPATSATDTYIQDYFSVSPHFFFTRIDAKDLNTGTGAVLLSSLAYGISFSWKQEWSPKIKTFEDLGLNHIDFIDNNISPVAISNASLNLYNFGLGAEYNFSSDLIFGGKLMFNQEVYSHGLTTTSGVALDAVTVPSTQVWTKIKLLEKTPFVLSTQLDAKLLMPATAANYETNAGTGVGLKLIIEKQTEKYNFSYNLYYRQQVQNSSIADYTRRDVGINLTMDWK